MESGLNSTPHTQENFDRLDGATFKDLIEQPTIPCLTDKELPEIDRQLEKTIELLKLFFNTAQQSGISSKSAPLIAQLIDYKDRFKDATEAISELPASSLKNIKTFFEQFYTNLKVELQKSEQALYSSQTSYKNALSGITEIANPSSHLPDEITLDLFSGYDLDTPNGLRDKPADELIKKILKAFGHKNFGATLFERRDPKNSSFSFRIVPNNVKNLIKYQGLSSDACLDAEHARPTLLALREELRGQLCVIERYTELQEILDKTENESIIEEVLAIFKIPERIIQSEMNAYARGSRKPTSSELAQTPLQIQQAVFASFDLRQKQLLVNTKKADIALCESINTPLIALLDSAINIANPRDQAAQDEYARQQILRVSERCLEDPVMFVKFRLSDVISTFQNASELQKHSIIGALVTEIDSISWFQFWKFEHRRVIQNSLKDILIEDITQLNQNLSKENTEDIKSSATLARVVEATKVLSTKDCSQIMAQLWKLPIDLELIEYAAKQIFGTSEARENESPEEKRARAARRIADTAENFRMTEDSLKELRE